MKLINIASTILSNYFKPGDIVKCIDANGSRTDQHKNLILTGQKYIVKRICDSLYHRYRYLQLENIGQSIDIYGDRFFANCFKKVDKA